MSYRNAKGMGKGVVCAFAHRALRNTNRSVLQLLFLGSAIPLFLTVLLFFAIFSPPFLRAQSGLLPITPANPDAPVCPVTSHSQSATLNVPEYPGPRRPVGGDYVVIEYNVDGFKASWSDYKRSFGFRGGDGLAHRIDANGSFLPVIEAKEKMAVRVCGLHFTDVLTVTTSPTGVPEGGADIRGATVVTPPVSSLTSTLDTLQSGTATGGTTTLPGLGLSAPTALTSPAISGITPGALGAEDQTPGKYSTYTPAQVTISGKQVALLLFSVFKNTAEIRRLIDRTMGRPYDAAPDNPRAGIQLGEQNNASSYDPQSGHAFGAYGSKSAPGSVNGVAYTLGRDLETVNADSQDRTNAAAFDKDMTEVQNVNAQISTLAGALSSQAFASNTLVLLSNYSTLRGLLDLARLGARDGKENNCRLSQTYFPTQDLSGLSQDILSKFTIDDFAHLTPSQLLSLTKKQLDSLPKPPKGSKETPLETRVEAMQAALIKAGVTSTGPSGVGDQPLCSVFEKQKFDDFWNAFDHQVTILLCPQNAQCKVECADDVTCMARYISPTDINDFEGKVGDELFKLNDDLNTLRSRIGDIDAITARLYDRMNEWYQASSVEQTDLLQPLTANSYLRISIVVQRGYTPFTLANSSGTFTATASTNVPPTAAAAASTSTPAHAVKTILVEVHRVANFNLIGGVMLIHIPTATFAAVPGTAIATPTTAPSTGPWMGTCGSTTSPIPGSASATSAPAYACVVQTQTTQWQVAGMAGVVWFPWGHDYFPRHSGYANFGRNLLPSMMLATSVTSLGNSMGGVNWEPVSGIDFYAGIASAQKTALPSILSVNSVLPAGSTVSQVTTEHAGFSIGVGLDLSVITQMFSSKINSVAAIP